MSPETWATLVGAVVGGLIGGLFGLGGVILQARITEQKDRETRLTVFGAFLASWRDLLEREVKRDLLHNERNVQNYKNHLMEFARQAVIVERDLPRTSRERFRELVAKAGSYSDSDIDGQTRAKNLQILSDIEKLLSFTG
jgi:hypothetical protein